ncbi:ABC transporter ATP-binding protein [Marinobacterium weihaiense]|uniref:ABC transporter ATP-binding protein n=1 Tax=Marinobacterium weihaiense TaxID=2851016 RepID=A0ABS6M7P7_9GAMM|nr:ABC transporter ATP-binding protein [Marinobacterium weihaiense]MBV0932303.1 ABC transporter ATP-binding protein [Marinobacterium weihaiense]
MITVTNLSKSFKLYGHPADRLKEIIFRRCYHHTHHALQDISFSVESGETLGILGRNGAGKSTLLKILNGVLMPDAGHVSLSGRITGLLELGTGFDTALSGRHNIYTNGLLLGMTTAEIQAREQHIIEFSELGTFIDEPLRTYSSGMVMRLAFSIAIHADPTCFLIDEALSVGDGHFQQKCMKRIREFRSNGGSIIFVSHDLNAVKMICDRAIVLDNGHVAYSGPPEAAVNAYNKIMARMEEDPVMRSESTVKADYGTGEVRIESARIMGHGSDSHIISTGETARLEVLIKARESVEKLSAGFMIRDRFGQDIFGTNTHLLGQSHSITAGETHTLVFDFPMHLSAGKYTLTLALHQDVDHLEHCYHWCDSYLSFEVAGSQVPLFSGVTYLPVNLSLNP